MEVVELVGEMLRTRTSPSEDLLARVREGLSERCDPVFYFIGCYGGFLFSEDSNNNELEQAVAQNEKDCLRKASVLLTKRTKRVSNFKRAVLLLTHGAMHKCWWGRCQEPLAPNYRDALERVRAQLKLNVSDLERTDLCLEVMLCLGERPDRGQCVRLLHEYQSMKPTVPRAHVSMLLKHFCDQDACVAATDTYLLDEALAFAQRPSSSYPETFEFRTNEMADKEAFDRLTRHVVENVLMVREYDVLPGMAYVRIKDKHGCYTKLHSDYENVVKVRQVVRPEDAELVRTVWVALHDIDESMSMLRFARRPKRASIRRGEVLVFDLNEEHYATTHRSRKPRTSIDFRILIKK